jgi:hypothetical protein
MEINCIEPSLSVRLPLASLKQEKNLRPKKEIGNQKYKPRIWKPEY